MVEKNKFYLETNVIQSRGCGRATVSLGSLIVVMIVQSGAARWGQRTSKGMVLLRQSINLRTNLHAV